MSTSFDIYSNRETDRVAHYPLHPYPLSLDYEDSGQLVWYSTVPYCDLFFILVCIPVVPGMNGPRGMFSTFLEAHAFEPSASCSPAFSLDAFFSKESMLQGKRSTVDLPARDLEIVSPHQPLDSQAGDAIRNLLRTKIRR